MMTEQQHQQVLEEQVEEEILHKKAITNKLTANRIIIEDSENTNLLNKVLSLFYSLFMNKKIKQNMLQSKNEEDIQDSVENTTLVKEVASLTPMQVKANQFIAIKEYDLLHKMVTNGYELLPMQRQWVEDYVQDLLLDYDVNSVIIKNHHTIENWLELGIKLKEESIIRYFSQRVHYSKKIDHTNWQETRQVDFNELYNWSFFYESNSNMKGKINGQIVENPLLTTHLKNYAKENKIFYNIFVELIEQLQKTRQYGDYHSNKRDKALLYEILTDERKDFLLKEIDFEKFLEVITKFNKMTADTEYREIKKLLQSILKNDYKNNLKQLINNVKHDYSNTVIEKLVIENVKDDNSHISIDKLPSEAKDILERMNVLYKKIQDSDIQPTEEQLYNVNNLLEKRVPEILKKYLTIDDYYKTTLVNAKGQNAQELMIDSLNNIYSNFVQTWENINSEALSSLSATNKYTKSFKK